MVTKPSLQVNIHEAKTHFSRYVDRAALGETLVIAKAGKPMAKLVPIDHAPPKRKSILGAMPGHMVDDETWREMDKEIEEMFIESINKPL
ncbi:MAG: type II toxin-antitoxin system Phd/YefM family antitoxin [Beijerinckiaceae bacterium]